MSAPALKTVARLRVRAGETPAIALCGADWPAFWQQVCGRLRRDGFRPGTLRVYRQVLRDLRQFLRDRCGIARPGGVTPETARAFQESLSEKNVSWCWMATVDDPSGLRSRTVPVPQGLLPLFSGLVAISRRSDPMICGRRHDGTGPKPLCARQAERIVQAAAQRAGLLKPVTPMSLRHTYGLRRIIAGDNVREIQEAMGHHSLETTLRYQKCLPPKVISPADPQPPPGAVLNDLAACLQRLSAAFPAPAPAPEAPAVTAVAPATSSPQAVSPAIPERGPLFPQAP